jgi:hypothetical protein
MTTQIFTEKTQDDNKNAKTQKTQKRKNNNDVPQT